MRGKLRDKRATSKRDTLKRDSLKRESMERRRPSKRDTRTMIWLNQQDDDDFELDLQEDKAPAVKTPRKK